MNCIASILPQSLLRVLAFHSGVIFSALLIMLVLCVFIWAAFFRKPGRRKGARHHHWKSKAEAVAGNGVGRTPVRAARRRHKRRRPRQPINPTLAQTHGLPPVRDKQSTPPPAY